MLQFDDTVLTLPAGDQFYAAYEMVVVGSCLCHGHATTCVQPDQSQDSATVGGGRGEKEEEGGGGNAVFAYYSLTMPELLVTLDTAPHIAVEVLCKHFTLPFVLQPLDSPLSDHYKHACVHVYQIKMYSWGLTSDLVLAAMAAVVSLSTRLRFMLAELH